MMLLVPWQGTRWASESAVAGGALEAAGMISCFFYSTEDQARHYELSNIMSSQRSHIGQAFQLAAEGDA
jgi:hypothetical protein